MQLVVHAGTPCTGSTTIQHVLAGNRQQLRASGISYPFNSQDHEFLVRSLRQDSGFANILPDILRKQAASGCHTIVLSAPSLVRLSDPSWLKPLASAFDLKVVVYLRRQDVWLNAWYNRNVRDPWQPNGTRMSPEDFLETLIHHTWLDYTALLRRWAYAAGQDALEPVSYSAQRQGCAVRDILARIGGPHIGQLQWDGQWHGRSLPAPAIQILRQLDLHALQPSTRAILRQKTTEAVAKSGLPTSPMAFTPNQRTQVLRRFRETNRALFNTYLNDREDLEDFTTGEVSPTAAVGLCDLPAAETVLAGFMAPALRAIDRSTEKALKAAATKDAAKAQKPQSKQGEPTPSRLAVEGTDDQHEETEKVVQSSHWAKVPGDTVDIARRYAVKGGNPHVKIMRFLKSYLKINSVSDVGCGLGYWYRGAEKLGIADYVGYDIPEVDVDDRFMPNDKFIPCDLSQPFEPDRWYDVCCATEVAEHIPYKNARTFIHNTTNFADVVLFSAAIPYQAGKGHVNENWVAFWNALYREKGYVCYDIFRFRNWDDPSIPVFYRQNILIYVREGSDAEKAFAGEAKTENPLSVVHPEMWIKAVNRGKASNHDRTENDVVIYYNETLNGEIESQDYCYGQEEYWKLRRG